MNPANKVSYASLTTSICLRCEAHQVGKILYILGDESGAKWSKSLHSDTSFSQKATNTRVKDFYEV